MDVSIENMDKLRRLHSISSIVVKSQRLPKIPASTNNLSCMYSEQ